MSKKVSVSNGFHPVSAPDFLPEGPLRALQLQRLQAIVQRAYDHQALFRDRLRERDDDRPRGHVADALPVPPAIMESPPFSVISPSWLSLVTASTPPA